MFIRFNGKTSAILISSDMIGAVSPYQDVFDESDVPTKPRDNYFHTEKKVSCRKDKYRSTYEKATQDERGLPMWGMRQPSPRLSILPSTLSIGKRN